jgi:hypothetical protein
VAGAAAVLLGVALLALAGPVAGAALSRLPGDAVLQDLRAGTARPPADLQRLLDSRATAGRWRDDPRDLTERALAQVLMAELLFAKARDAGPARLRAAERDLTAALGAAPADPFAWTRLALVRWRLGRPDRSIRAALDAARTTGPQSRRLQPVQRALAARLTAARDD